MITLIDENLSDFWQSFPERGDAAALARDLYEIEKSGNVKEVYWHEETYFNHLKEGHDRIFAQLNDGVIEAFAFYRPIDPEVEVTHWSVRKKGKGEGKQFFQKFLAQIGNRAQKVIIDCGEWNEAASKIYKLFCFERTGFRPSYYRSGEGAWIMERALKS